MKLWGGSLPAKEPEKLIRELYMAENEGKPEPSGSQDMAGIIYPGVSRLDYDFSYDFLVFRGPRCSRAGMAVLGECGGRSLRFS